MGPTDHAATQLNSSDSSNSAPSSQQCGDAAVAFISASDAAAHICFAVSETTFIFAGSRTAFPGECMLEWAAAGGRNADGVRGHVSVLETREGAGGKCLGRGEHPKILLIPSPNYSHPFLSPSYLRCSRWCPICW